MQGDAGSAFVGVHRRSITDFRIFVILKFFFGACRETLSDTLSYASFKSKLFRHALFSFRSVGTPSIATVMQGAAGSAFIGVHRRSITDFRTLYNLFNLVVACREKLSDIFSALLTQSELFRHAIFSSRSVETPSIATVMQGAAGSAFVGVHRRSIIDLRLFIITNFVVACREILFDAYRSGYIKSELFRHAIFSSRSVGTLSIATVTQSAAGSAFVGVHRRSIIDFRNVFYLIKIILVACREKLSDIFSALLTQSGLFRHAICYYRFVGAPSIATVTQGTAGSTIVGVHRRSITDLGRFNKRIVVACREKLSDIYSVNLSQSGLFRHAIFSSRSVGTPSIATVMQGSAGSAFVGVHRHSITDFEFFLIFVDILKVVACREKLSDIFSVNLTQSGLFRHAICYYRFVGTPSIATVTQGTTGSTIVGVHRRSITGFSKFFLKRFFVACREKLSDISSVNLSQSELFRHAIFSSRSVGTPSIATVTQGTAGSAFVGVHRRSITDFRMFIIIYLFFVACREKLSISRYFVIIVLKLFRHAAFSSLFVGTPSIAATRRCASGSTFVVARRRSISDSGIFLIFCIISVACREALSIMYSFMSILLRILRHVTFSLYSAAAPSVAVTTRYAAGWSFVVVRRRSITNLSIFKYFNTLLFACRETLSDTYRSIANQSELFRHAIFSSRSEGTPFVAATTPCNNCSDSIIVRRRSISDFSIFKYTHILFVACREITFYVFIFIVFWLNKFRHAIFSFRSAGTPSVAATTQNAAGSAFVGFHHRSISGFRKKRFISINNVACRNTLSDTLSHDHTLSEAFRHALFSSRSAGTPSVDATTRDAAAKDDVGVRRHSISNFKTNNFIFINIVACREMLSNTFLHNSTLSETFRHAICSSRSVGTPSIAATRRDAAGSTFVGVHHHSISGFRIDSFFKTGLVACREMLSDTFQYISTLSETFRHAIFSSLSVGTPSIVATRRRAASSTFVGVHRRSISGFRKYSFINKKLVACRGMLSGASLHNSKLSETFRHAIFSSLSVGTSSIVATRRRAASSTFVGVHRHSVSGFKKYSFINKKLVACRGMLSGASLHNSKLSETFRHAIFSSLSVGTLSVAATRRCSAGSTFVGVHRRSISGFKKNSFIHINIVACRDTSSGAFLHNFSFSKIFRHALFSFFSVGTPSVAATRRCYAGSDDVVVRRRSVTGFKIINVFLLYLVACRETLSDTFQYVSTLSETFRHAIFSSRSVGTPSVAAAGRFATGSDDVVVRRRSTTGFKIINFILMCLVACRETLSDKFQYVSTPSETFRHAIFSSLSVGTSSVAATSRCAAGSDDVIVRRRSTTGFRKDSSGHINIIARRETLSDAFCSLSTSSKLFRHAICCCPVAETPFVANTMQDTVGSYGIDVRRRSISGIEVYTYIKFFLVACRESISYTFSIIPMSSKIFRHAIFSSQVAETPLVAATTRGSAASSFVVVRRRSSSDFILYKYIHSFLVACRERFSDVCLSFSLPSEIFRHAIFSSRIAETPSVAATKRYSACSAFVGVRRRSDKDVMMVSLTNSRVVTCRDMSFTASFSLALTNGG